MGLFGGKTRSTDEQQVFAESNYYEFYKKWAGHKCTASKDDYFIASSHAMFALLQYMRSLEDALEELQSEVKEMKEKLSK